jgi:hypothetical protein
MPESVFQFLFDLFGDEEARTEYAEDPEGYTEDHLPEGLTGADVLAAIPSVCAALPPEQAAVVRAAYGLSGDGGSDGGSTGGSGGGGGGGGGGPQLPPPPTPDPGDTAIESVVEQVNYYTTVVNTTNQYFEDNDTTYIDDRDTTVDNSVNQNIEAFGDVIQDFDNDVVSGDGAVAAGDGSQVNTGDGAVQAGDDIEDSTVNTGTVGGSVTGDISDSNVVGGDANGSAIDSTLDDSILGDNNTAAIDNDGSAIAFGDGDAINAENVNQGDGTLIDDVSTGGGDANFNTGSGDQAVVSDSNVNDSAVGQGNQVQANDFDVDADDGAAVNFGSGDAEGNNVEIDGDVDGNVQVATGDNNDQTALNDESFEDNSINDSFNDQSTNVDASINDSFDDNTAVDASDDDGLDLDVQDNTLDASDDDVLDLDV